MKAVFLLTASLGLGACGISLPDLGPTPVTAPANRVAPARLDGVGLTAQNSTVPSTVDADNGSPSTGTPFGAQGSTITSASFTASDVTISFGSGKTYTFTWDESAKAYVHSTPEANGQTSTITLNVYDDALKPGVYAMKFATLDKSVDPNWIQTGYSSFSTNPTTNLPTSGTADYLGLVNVTDQMQQSANGTLGLRADLKKGTVAGLITIDKGTVFGATSFAMAGAIGRGAGGATFAGYLGNSDLSTVYANSGIAGIFTGDKGKYLSGNFYLNDTKNNALAGVFTAND